MEGFTYRICVVQTQVCPLLVDIEMNRSSSNPGALLAYQNSKTGVFHSVINGALGCGTSLGLYVCEQIQLLPRCLTGSPESLNRLSHSTGPCMQVQ